MTGIELATCDPRLQRVREFLQAASVLKDPTHPLGQKARAQLPAATGLSPQNTEWALTHALEVDASDDDLRKLCDRTPPCARAHVLLSANVFVAALRAIAIGIASAPSVCVRPSRRESTMVELLADAAPGQFQRVDEIRPAAGEHCWAYGTDETLTALKRAWPPGVTLHGHGHGYGVAILDASDLLDQPAISAISVALAVDIAAFDQRGCLSPRVVLVTQCPNVEAQLAHCLAEALSQRELKIPVGQLSHAERAELQRYRATLCVVGQCIQAGQGLVTFETAPMPWMLPPIGRAIHVRGVPKVTDELNAHRRELTTIGVGSANSRLASRLAGEFPTVRIAEIGNMQTPPLDGPVDLRGGVGIVL